MKSIEEINMFLTRQKKGLEKPCIRFDYYPNDIMRSFYFAVDSALDIIESYLKKNHPDRIEGFLALLEREDYWRDKPSTDYIKKSPAKLLLVQKFPQFYQWLKEFPIEEGSWELREGSSELRDYSIQYNCTYHSVAQAYKLLHEIAASYLLEVNPYRLRAYQVMEIDFLYGGLNSPLIQNARDTFRAFKALGGIESARQNAMRYFRECYIDCSTVVDYLKSKRDLDASYELCSAIMCSGNPKEYFKAHRDAILAGEIPDPNTIEPRWADLEVVDGQLREKKQRGDALDEYKEEMPIRRGSHRRASGRASYQRSNPRGYGNARQEQALFQGRESAPLIPRENSNQGDACPCVIL